jgi:30S ribosomal protein S31
LARLKDFINFVRYSYNYLIIKIMGKGDKKTKRGKILMGSYGVRRLRRKLEKTIPLIALKEEKPVVAGKEKAPAKPKVEKVEVQVEFPKVEAQLESPKVATPVEKAVKPPRKKAPPKASAKKEDKTEK